MHCRIQRSPLLLQVSKTDCGGTAMVAFSFLRNAVMIRKPGKILSSPSPPAYRRHAQFLLFVGLAFGADLALVFATRAT